MVIKLLQQIDSHDKDGVRAFEARCLLVSLNEDFCLLLVAVKEILMNCRATSDFLQIRRILLLMQWILLKI